jgi:hypothetical protein
MDERGEHETAMEWPADMSMDEEHRQRPRKV